MSNQYQYRADIDGLRAVAVLSVIGFHYRSEWLPGGFTGVDIFFVISGFLITDILRAGIDEGNFSLQRFYIRRIRRIMPALALVLLATIVVGWFMMLPRDYVSLAKSAIYASAGLGNLFFYQNTGYFDRAAELQPLLHTWSLGVEEQFYLVWPAALYGLLRVCQAQWLRASGVLAFTVIGLFYADVTVAQNESYAFYLPHPRAWELALGALIAFAPHIRPKLAREVIAGIGLALVAYSMFAIRFADPFPGLNALYACAGSALLIVGGHRTVVACALSLPPLVVIGLISYSLYLWHWPILVLMGDVYHHGVLLAATAVLSVASYWLVERPGKALSSIFAPVAAMSFCATAALAIVYHEGIPTRLPTPQRELAAFKYDNFEDWRITRCFLNPDQNQWAPECENPVAVENLSKIVLWGDSLAAHIYPGLKWITAPRPHISVMQFTASLCPPFLKPELISDRPNCLLTNRQAVKAIERQKPKVAFLSGAWFHYLSLLPRGEDLVSALRPTVEALKRSGVERVYLIGPFPGWDEPLPNVLMSYLEAFGTVPNRTDYKLTRSILRQDPVLRKTASSLGIGFISAIEAMCNADGCVTKTGGTSTLTAFDTGHLTAEGAKYFVEQVSDQILWPKK